MSHAAHRWLTTVKLHKDLKKPAGKEGRNDQPIYQLRKLKLRVTGESPAQSHTAGRQEKGGQFTRRHFGAKCSVPPSAQCVGVVCGTRVLRTRWGSAGGEAHPGTAVEGINGVRKDSRS